MITPVAGKNLAIGACRTVTARILAAAVLLLLAQSAPAQDAWPIKAVRIINPFGAGGTLDAVIRPLAEQLSQRWGRPVTVENKPGAAGGIGTDFVAKAAPDGYTVLVTLSNTHITNVVLNSKLPYDPFKDFEPVTQICSGGVVLIAPRAHPANTASELLAWARATNKRVTFGSWGSGSSGHVYGELLRRQSGLELVHVPYKGDVPAIFDVIAGNIDVTFSGPASAGVQVKAEKVKILAVTGTRRLMAFPDAATFAAYASNPSSADEH